MKGQFIVVEGLEGAGKSTAIQCIQRYLQSKEQTLVVTREPGGTGIGEGLRSLMKENIPGEPLEPLSELLMMYAARVQLIKQVIQPALQRGDWVLADRFELSTFAYQGGGRGIAKSVIDTLSKLCVADCKPTMILFMDITPSQGLERVKSRGTLDRMEQESLDFFNKVHQAYHQCIQDMDNVTRIDASMPLDLVTKAVLKPVEDFFNHG